MASLQDSFWSTVFCDDTDYASVGFANGVASLPPPLASCFLELEKANQDLGGKLRNDFHSILDSFDRLSLSPTSHPPPLAPDPPTRTTSATHTSFSVAAYSWLLENIANPYPSSATKKSFAQRHDCSLSSVNSWFVNARRRIGWTALCRDYFHNCRGDALDAAHRAFVKEDSNRPLLPDIIHAFVGVKVAAEDLYSSIFTKSALAGDIDVAVKNVSCHDAAPVGVQEHCEPEEVAGSPKALGTELLSRERSFYSSSDYSSSSSPVPPLDESLTDDSEEEQEILPPILAGRKRRLSSSESGHSPVLHTKRRRRVRPCSIEPGVLPSERFLEPGQISVVPQPLANISAPRKERSSDTDVTAGILHRPQGLASGLCVHAVPDPFPLLTLDSDPNIDEWFRSNFDDLFSLPPPVDTVGPDLSAQWEVEFFNNYNIPQGAHQRTSNLPNSPDEDKSSTPAELSAFDGFLQSFQTDGFITPIDSTITSSATDTVSQDSTLSSEFIDWTALLNAEACGPALDSILDQLHTNPLPLSGIDLSILQLP